MKKVYAVILKSDTDGLDMCRLMENRSPRTAFPGCWDVPDDTDEAADTLASAINGFMDFPDTDNMVFGVSENLSERLISRLSAEKVIKTNVQRLAELIGSI